MVLSQRGDVDVVVPVVVVISHGAAKPVHFNGETCLLRYVGEGSIFIVVIKSRE
jgi:hypothetical protein